MMRAYLSRLAGAVTLDASTYEGIEADRSVTWQAAITVLVSSLATGIGATAWFQLTAGAVLTLAAIALTTWVAWATLVFQIGSRVLPSPATDATLGELLRTTGFAAAPGLLQLLALLPSIATPIFALTTAWMFAAMVVAIQHALDYSSTARAIAVCGLAAGLCLVTAALLALALSRALS
jgi:hypothetical protein